MILIILMLVWKKHLNIWGSWVKSTPFATILCLKNKKVHQSSYFAFFFAKKQASLLHAKAADCRRVAATRGGWPGLECKLASWAEDGRDPFHFFESRIPRKGSPSCLLPVTYSYSHPGHLCLFSSDPESLSVHTPPSLLSELKATNPPLTPPLSCSGATAVVTWGQALPCS